MKNKIVVFGASVTKQKNGYAAILKKSHVISEFYGFGGYHLFNGGIAKLKDLPRDTDVLLIDWFNTAYENQDKLLNEHLDLIKSYCSEIRSSLVVLLIPKVNFNDSFYTEVITYCNDGLVPLIDMRHMVEEKDVFRDGIHTTGYGSQLIASFISKKLDEIVHKPILIDRIYTPVKEYKLNKKIKGNMQISGTGRIVGFEHIKGPHTGSIALVRKYQMSDLILRDRWCDFYRDSMDINLDIDNELLLLATGDEPLYVRKIYYQGSIGFSLNIRGTLNGLKFYIIYTKMIVNRFIHILQRAR